MKGKQRPAFARKARERTGAVWHVSESRGPVKKKCRGCSGLRGQPGRGRGRDVAQLDGKIGDRVRQEGKQFTEDVVGHDNRVRTLTKQDIHGRRPRSRGIGFGFLGGKSFDN